MRQVARWRLSYVRDFPCDIMLTLPENGQPHWMWYNHGLQGKKGC